MSDEPVLLERDPPAEGQPARPEAAARGEPEEEHVPGEEGVWVFILGDMTVFGVLFGAFLYTRIQEPALFAEWGPTLNTTIGAANTLILLTSSLFVVTAVRALRREMRRRASHLILAAGACAAGFVALKGVEYSQKLGDGLTPATNEFFMYFYVVTGLHFLHLLVGAAVLAFMWRAARRVVAGRRERLLIEGGASYWHMVDLLWVIIFPLLYFGWAS